MKDYYVVYERAEKDSPSNILTNGVYLSAASKREAVDRIVALEDNDYRYICLNVVELEG